MCMIEGAERGEVYSERMQRARKPYRCGECGRGIAIGETYRYAFSVYEGHADTYRTCGHCTVMQDWLSRNCNGWVFGAVCDDINEHRAEYPALGRPLGRLVVGHRRGWRAMRGGLMPIPTLPPGAASMMVETTR
jgi:hypothetical protein